MNRKQMSNSINAKKKQISHIHTHTHTFARSLSLSLSSFLFFLFFFRSFIPSVSLNLTYIYKYEYLRNISNELTWESAGLGLQLDIPQTPWHQYRRYYCARDCGHCRARGAECTGMSIQHTHTPLCLYFFLSRSLSIICHLYIYM